MALARDVADHLEAVGETNLRDLAQRRVRLLGGRCVDARANSALLRALLQRRHLLARLLHHPRMADQLIDRRHALPSPSFKTFVPPSRHGKTAPKQRARHPLPLGGSALIHSQRTTAKEAAIMHLLF